jgi:hypothetical protein
MSDATDTGVVGQQGLLPTPNDPKLWLVTCKAGHEREAVVQLLQKSYTLAERGQPLRILSAVALDHLPVRRTGGRRRWQPPRSYYLRARGGGFVRLGSKAQVERT